MSERYEVMIKGQVHTTPTVVRAKKYAVFTLKTKRSNHNSYIECVTFKNEEHFAFLENVEKDDWVAVNGWILTGKYEKKGIEVNSIKIRIEELKTLDDLNNHDVEVPIISTSTPPKIMPKREVSEDEEDGFVPVSDYEEVEDELPFA